MRKLRVLLAAALLMATVNLTNAQDFMSSNPKMCKLLGDTLKSKMMLVTFPVGATTTLHSHPTHIVYALTPGVLKVAYENGKTETMHIKAGQSVTFPPEEPHRTTNVGKAVLKLILLEISE